MIGFSRFSPSPLLPRSSRGLDHFVCARGAQFSLWPFSRIFGGRGRLRGMHSSASPISPVLWVQARHTDSEAGSPNLLPAVNLSPHSVLRVTHINPVLFCVGGAVPFPLLFLAGSLQARPNPWQTLLLPRTPPPPQ